jgi:hypothetical protein
MDQVIKNPNIFSRSLIFIERSLWRAFYYFLLIIFEPTSLFSFISTGVDEYDETGYDLIFVHRRSERDKYSDKDYRLIKGFIGESNPSIKRCLEVVKIEPNLFQFIKNPHINVCIEALRSDQAQNINPLMFSYVSIVSNPSHAETLLNLYKKKDVISKMNKSFKN